MTAALMATFAFPPQSAAGQTALRRDGAEDARCRRQREAAIISGEIVVCAGRGDRDQHRLRRDGDAAAAYARATMNRGMAAKPDFAPPPWRPNLLTFCPKFGDPPPPPPDVDFSRLPEAPPGSDAARHSGRAPQA